MSSEIFQIKNSLRNLIKRNYTNYIIKFNMDNFEVNKI
jgi:hypothetical protein